MAALQDTNACESTEREQNVTTMNFCYLKERNEIRHMVAPPCSAGLVEERLSIGGMTVVMHTCAGRATHASPQVICCKGVNRGVFSQATWV